MAGAALICLRTDGGSYRTARAPIQAFARNQRHGISPLVDSQPLYGDCDVAIWSKSHAGNGAAKGFQNDFTPRMRCQTTMAWLQPYALIKTEGPNPQAAHVESKINVQTPMLMARDERCWQGKLVPRAYKPRNCGKPVGRKTPALFLLLHQDAHEVGAPPAVGRHQLY